MTRTGESGPVKSGALAFGLLVVLVVSLLTAKPAHAATFTVNSTNDLEDVNPGDGVCDVNNIPGIDACTLRAAIQEANAARGADAISFGIGSGDGVKTISPANELPEITDAVTIDGYTQAGATQNTLPVGTNAVLKIELDGSGAGGQASGIEISTTNTVVRGLVINDFGFNGVNILGNPADVSSNTVEGNFIGTDPSGTGGRGNRTGVFDSSGGRNIIGGATPAARNLISGNSRGVDIFGRGLNEVSGNLIGTKKDGSTALGNDDEGVQIFRSSKNIVGGGDPEAANTIAFNGLDGVGISDGGLGGATGNRVLGNSIFSNGGLGIDLGDDGPTTSDLKDPDAGPNTLQNFPVLTSATSNGTTTIEGTLNSTPSVKRKKKRPIRRAFTIQFFADPSGGDEGELFLGQKTVTTNRQGNVSFTFVSGLRVPPGLPVTATATRNSTGSTSEFSEPRIVTAA